MTIYQEEMIRKANRYGCDTTYDEGSGRLQVTYNGQHLMDVDVRGHLYYTARDQPDEDVEDMRTALLEEGREIREYVEAYETAPQMKAKDVRNYRKLSEFRDTVLAAMYSPVHGFMFCSWRQSKDGTSVAHGDYPQDYAYSKETFAVRSGLLQPKGKKNGKVKYTVVSHISDKRKAKIQKRATDLVEKIKFPANENEEHKFIMHYNSYVLGVHNYYRIATHVSRDFAEIGFSVKRTMKCRLGQRLKKSGNSLPQYVQKLYGRSNQLRFIRGLFVLPIAYVQTSPPKHRARNWSVYTPEGRADIHKTLEKVNIGILHYLMKNPVQGESIEFNDNRLALYCAQQGKCAVTGKPLKS